MHMLSCLRRTSSFCLVAAVLFCVGSGRAEAGSPKETGVVTNIGARAMSSLRNASVRDLEDALESPTIQTISLKSALGNPEYMYYPTRLERFMFETLGEGKGLDGGEVTLSQEARLECLRAWGAASALMATNSHVVAKTLLVRKDKETPSLLDGMIAYAAISAGWQIVAEEQRSVWKELLQSKNPVCRLVALARARTWSDKADSKGIVALALADSYCYTRECGLNYISFLPRQEGAAAVKRYIEAERAAAPSEEAQRREDRLRDMALRLFNELSKDVK